MKPGTLLSGLKWSFLERASVIILQLVLEVILARLLVPEDYGILGMIMVVVAFATVFIDGGFSNALIHYQDRKEADYAAVFYLSILIGVVCYVVLFLSAPAISNFYGKDLSLMIRVIGLSILFNSFGVLYKARLSIDMNFKKQTVFSGIAMLISGVVGVLMALNSYGVWSLIVQLLIFSLLSNFFLFFHFKMVPKVNFERGAMNRILGFGSKIFVSSVLQAVYFNAYPIVLGKMYSSSIVGLYTKANQLSIYPASIFSGVLQRVFYPYLAKIQSDKMQIYAHHLKFTRIYALIAFPVAATVMYFAKPIVLTLLSSSWIDIILPLQILLASSAFFPLIILNMNIFQVLGKSSMFLKTEICTKVLGIGILFTTFKLGFMAICVGIFIQIVLQFLVTSIISSKLLNNSILSPISASLKFAAVSAILYALIFYLGLEVEAGLFHAVAAFFLFAILYSSINFCISKPEYKEVLRLIKIKLR